MPSNWHAAFLKAPWLVSTAAAVVSHLFPRIRFRVQAETALALPHEKQIRHGIVRAGRHGIPCGISALHGQLHIVTAMTGTAHRRQQGSRVD
ncbi:hypothetical protein GCM10023346_04920 [Arthrobacter gyeryongensis]|uniref:Secreted protein n=1 Tax=Arthrobacter gyeryongensis TaxID=1650592 RepID=A0ABP9S2C6_9MICC